MLTIVADENIPFIDHFFADIANIIRLPGRSISARDLVGADALLVRSVTKVTSDLLRGSSVQFVGSCTIGTDHIDQQDLNQLGIAWANAPGCNAHSVVQYVLSAMASFEEDWLHKKVGVIGCGNVGGRLIRALTRLGVNCIGYDPFLVYQPYLRSLDEVLACDIISCHTPLTLTGDYPSHNLLQDDLLRLKPNTLLINAGRGGVINEAFAKEAVIQNGLRLVLDVWSHEPAIDPELLAMTCAGTPHIAGYSLEGKARGTYAVYQAFCAHFGWEAKKTLPDLGMLTVEPAKSFNDCLLQIYPIGSDSQQLKNWREHSSDLGSYFDQLRKHYPVRRDYSAYTTTDSQWSSTLVELFD